MIFRRSRENGLEAEILLALKEGDDRSIEAWLRGYATHYVRNAVASLAREEAMAMIARGGEARIAAMAEHPDGRVREAAIWALTPDAATALPALLRRANDWVTVVARLASERALTALPQADDTNLAEILPLIFALTRKGRGDHRALVAAYLAQVRARPGLARRIRRAYRNGTVGEWASWQVVGEEETAHDLRQERLRAGTPRLQLETARQVAGEPGRWRELLASHNPQVRRLALDHAPREAVEAALSDPNARVRNDARYLFGKWYYPERYRRLLPAPGAISGLAETGSRNHADLLVPLLRHPRVEIRCRTVEALFRLLENDAEPYLLAMLRDPSRKVQSAAVDALVRSSLGFDPESVLRWPLTASMRQRLLRRTPRWAALLAMLREADDLEGADEWLVRWAREAGYGRIPPKPAEIAEARRLLQEVRLRPETASALRDSLTAWP